MRLATFGVLLSATVMDLAQPATAAYLALGDSITFGETDLLYRPSFGDRGYVGLYADYLASLNGGTRPTTLNLAIDGETTSSFTSGVGRVPPVAGRTDAILAAENLNYNPNALVTQNTQFLSKVAAQQSAGDPINTVSISLGFNDLAALASVPNPLAQLPTTLTTYRNNYSALLSEVRQVLPDAKLLILNYYNSFPVDPNSPAAPIFATGGPLLNGIIRDLATQYNGTYVDTFTPFVGNEAAYTYQAAQPTGTIVPPPFGGAVPIGNVHPNATGYQVIADQAIAAQPAAVPEPSGDLALLGAGGVVGWQTLRSRHRRSFSA